MGNSTKQPLDTMNITENNLCMSILCSVATNAHGGAMFMTCGESVVNIGIVPREQRIEEAINELVTEKKQKAEVVKQVKLLKSKIGRRVFIALYTSSGH